MVTHTIPGLSEEKDDCEEEEVNLYRPRPKYSSNASETRLKRAIRTL